MGWSRALGQGAQAATGLKLTFQVRLVGRASAFAATALTAAVLFAAAANAGAGAGLGALKLRSSNMRRHGARGGAGDPTSALRGDLRRDLTSTGRQKQAQHMRKINMEVS